MPTNRNHIGSHARNAVSELQMEAKAIGCRAQERANELTDAARHRAESFQHELEDKITRNPLKSVLIAAGCGVLLGCLWRR